MALIGLLGLAFVPSAYLERVTTFDPEVDAPGQESLQNRLLVVTSALKMAASDPLFGAGLGNFPWVARVFYNSGGATHNSYLWAITSGGVGALVLYLLLFYVTFRMLRQLEKYGPRELLWLSKALRVNLVTFLIFSGFADFWLSDFLYLIMGLAVAMTYVWRREAGTSAPVRAERDQRVQPLMLQTSER
jgi:O-antigen ligase